MSDSFSNRLKGSALVYVVNALLVVLALFLAWRILAPSYTRKESTSVNRMGIFHTQLAAERLGARLGVLREELKENALKLVDPTRGPVALDSTRWLWLRMQDRDWRAPNYLDPLPPAHEDVDNWRVSVAKNSFVLSERVPIIREGVQDFVLVEGGLRSTILQDLQTDPDYGVWVFDLDAYKKGGLSIAKVYERTSAAGGLTKEELKLLTPDLLGQIFQSADVTMLPSESTWALSFKNSSGPSRLGVLGYWLPQGAPAQLSGAWTSLTIALLVLSAMASFFLTRVRGLLGTPPEAEARVERVAVAKEPAKSLPSAADAAAVDNSPPSVQGMSLWVRRIANDLRDSFGHLQDRVEMANDFLKSSTEEKARRALLSLEKAGREIHKGRLQVERMETLANPTLNFELESTDLEIFYKTLVRQERDFPHVDTFFDPDLWRVRVNAQPLGTALRVFLQFLLQNTSPTNRAQASFRYLASDVEDASLTEVVRAPDLKAPFVRIHLRIDPIAPFGRQHLVELFDLKHGLSKGDLDLPFAAKLIEKLHGRLRVKSNSEDGTVFYIDLPVFEARKPEDKINAKQLDEVPETSQVSQVGDFSVPVSTASFVQEIKKADPPMMETQWHQTQVDTNAVPTVVSGASEELDARTVIQGSTEPPKPAAEPDVTAKSMRLSDIERANSFAENISDERSRVRSRFRIRRPGEKE